jgi:hypothetical protein
MAYDFMSGEYHNIDAKAPPFGNRSLISDPACLFDDPYCGRDPHPITPNANVEYPAFGTSGRWIPTLTPEDSVVERHGGNSSGTDWGVSVAYSGSHSDRLWAQVARQPWRLHGPWSVRHQWRFLYRVLDQHQSESAPGSLPDQPERGSVDRRARREHRDWLSNYKGVKLAAQRRSDPG